MNAGTVIVGAELAQARVLAGSFARHHPGETLAVVVADATAESPVDEHEPFRRLTPNDIGIPPEELHRMALLMGRGIVAALRPWLLGHLLAQQDGPAFCMASHVLIIDSLSTLEPVVPPDGVLLVPHVVNPLPRDGLDPDETTILGLGMFSSGIYGVGQDGGRFIDYLKVRLQRECEIDIPGMRMQDQRWLDFVPSLFPYYVERDVGVDAAYWNFHERPLSRSDGRILAGGTPLRSVNFSGFDPRLEGMIGTSEASGAPRVVGSSDPVLTELCEKYRRDLIAAGVAEIIHTPCRFDGLPGGLPIYNSLPPLYSSALADAEKAGTRLPPDPFDGARSGEFLEWCRNAYAAAARQVPVRLRQLSVSGSAEPLSEGLRSRIRRRSRRTASTALGHEEFRTGDAVVTDHLAALQVGRAGRRNRSEVVIDSSIAGVVLSGILGRLDPGRYQMTVEFTPGPRQSGLADADQAIVVEVASSGYLLGASAVTFGELESGTAPVAFSIPDSLERDSLVYGTDAFIRSRGQVSGSITAVLVERVGATESALPARRDWLPTMDVGAAGRRAGTEVDTVEDRLDFVVSGPQWRLPGGRYRVSLRTRSSTQSKVEIPNGIGEVGVVAVLDAVAGDAVLGEVSLTKRDMSDGSAQLLFEVTEDQAAPNARVGLRMRTHVGVAAVIESVTVELVG
jgi:hypothetical protein